MKRALVVVGENRGYQNVLLGLTRAECTPALVADLDAAAGLLAHDAMDLVVVDLALAAINSQGLSVFVAARKTGQRPIPVLGLAPSSEPDESFILDQLDDFVLAPFRPQEVALRASILLRRFSPAKNAEMIRRGSLLIDLARYEVTLDASRLDLTFKEYELLRFLAASPGNVFTRETLLNKVWGYDYFGGTRTVDVHVRRLRSKIEGTSTFIETVRNVGYRFREG